MALTESERWENRARNAESERDKFEEVLNWILVRCKRSLSRADSSDAVDEIEEVTFQALGGCIHCRQLPCESPAYCEGK